MPLLEAGLCGVPGRRGRPLCRPPWNEARRQGLARRVRLVLAAGMLCGFAGFYQCIKVFSETDLTEDLKRFDVPTLVIHGDDDQIVPIGASALRSSKLVKRVTLKIYQGAPHGLADTHKQQLNEDLLAFLRS